MLQGASVDSSHVAAAPLYSAAADLVFKPDIGPRRTASYRINGYCFRTTIFERSIAQGLERLLRPFAIDADGPMLEFTVEPASGSALMVCIDGVEKIRSDLENEIIGAMFQAIIESAYGNPQWLSILHSGAVIRDGRALLLTGQSGSGKTTLTAYLSATGFTYAADDMAALVAPDGLLAPWPVTQTLRPASWGALSEVIPQLVDIPVCASWKGEIKYFASPPQASPQELFPVQVILFPRYDAAAKRSSFNCARSKRCSVFLETASGSAILCGHLTCILSSPGLNIRPPMPCTIRNWTRLARSLSIMTSEQTLSRWDSYNLLCDLLKHCIDGSECALPVQPPWEQLITLSSHYLVTPALAWSLRDVSAVPIEVRDFLDAILALNRERNRTIIETLVSVLGVWDAEGIPSVLLKGAASLTTGLYPDSGIRILGDIDILVPSDRAEGAARLLEKDGFEEDSGDHGGRNHHHLPPLRHPDSGICIEIHKQVLAEKYIAFLPSVTAWGSAQKCEVGGYATHHLAPTERFIHAMVHTQLQDNHYFRRRLGLRQMMELAMLAQHQQNDIDWERIVKLFRAEKYYPALQEGCEILARLYGFERPAIITAPHRNPLRAVQRRLEGRFAWPADILCYSYRKIADNPYKVFNAFRSKSLLFHFKDMQKYASFENWK